MVDVLRMYEDSHPLLYFSHQEDSVQFSTPMNKMTSSTRAIIFLSYFVIFVLMSLTILMIMTPQYFVNVVRNERRQTWAVLVAGSRGWENYRHQADVCHAYQVLHHHGVPDDNIVVMMFDDIANSDDNPDRGKIYNKPGGPDVYQGVPKGMGGK